MYQYDHPTAVAVEPARSAAGDPGFYRNGNPALGVAATVLDAEHLNAMQNELLNVVVEAGIVPSKADDTQLYAAMVAIATAVAGGAAGTTGDIKMRALGTVPAGWLECNGQAVSRATYAALFAAIGTTYGVGDGATTFNLPNVDDLFPVGANGTTRNVGDVTAANLGELTITMRRATSPGSANDLNTPNIMTDDGGGTFISAPIEIAEAGAPGSTLEPASIAFLFVIKT